MCVPCQDAFRLEALRETHEVVLGPKGFFWWRMPVLICLTPSPAMMELPVKTEDLPGPAFWKTNR